MTSHFVENQLWINDKTSLIHQNWKVKHTNKLIKIHIKLKDCIFQYQYQIYSHCIIINKRQQLEQSLLSMIDFSAHSYKCYLRACINFSYALFHIFSGPLFANVEGYVYLDLLVWGLSPLTFLFLRQRFFTFFRNQTRDIRGQTFKGIIILTLFIFSSYFFLNYSPKFNWNYFSRTFNIEVGFFIFDMFIRTLQLIVEVEQEKEVDKECDTYCQFQHATLSLSYFLVFYLSSTYDVNQRNNGPIIFAICSLFSFLSILLVPILYYFHHKEDIMKYNKVQQNEQITSIETEIENIKPNKSNSLFCQPFSTIKSVLGLSMINISLIINTNYFSLFMMQPLGTSTDSSYQQYNITIQMVSGFFLLSTIGYYVAYRIFNQVKIAPLLSRLVLVVYGVFLAMAYWNYTVNYVSVLIIMFGFHQMSTMELTENLRPKWSVDMRLYLKNQVFSYFIMPIVFMMFNIGQTSLKVYILSSGIFLILGAILL